MNALLTKKKKNARKRPERTALPPGAPLLSKSYLAGGTPLQLPGNILRNLNKIRRRHLSIKFSEGLALIGMTLLALWLCQAIADWLFNLSWNARLLFLLLDAGIIAWLSHRFLVMPYRQRLNLRTAALLVEREIPAFRTALISAVELAEGGPDCPQGSIALVQRMMARVNQQIESAEILHRVIKKKELNRRLKGLAVVLLVVAGCAAFFYPKSLVLVQRLFLARVPLPTETIVLPITRNASIPAGTDIELSARAQGVIPRSGRLIIAYDDGQKETVPVSSQTGEPARFPVTLRNVRQALRYHFELNDGVGPDYKVSIRSVPSVASSRFIQVYPAYTGLKEAEMSPGNLSLLVGGHFRIEGSSTEPLKSSTLELEGLNQKVAMQINGADKRSIQYEFPVPQDGLKAFSMHLVSTRGEPSVDDPVYHVDLVSDRPPTAALTVPKLEKITVLANYKPILSFNIKDDFGIAKVTLHYEVFRPGPDGQPAAAEKGEIPIDFPPQSTTFTRTIPWDLSQMVPPLTIGSTITYWIEAEDNNTLSGPGIGQSRKKTMTVVSEEAKKAELLDALGEKATEIEHIYNSEQKLNEKTDSSIRANN